MGEFLLSLPPDVQHAIAFCIGVVIGIPIAKGLIRMLDWIVD